MSLVDMHLGIVSKELAGLDRNAVLCLGRPVLIHCSRCAACCVIGYSAELVGVVS
jgi:hypothetical protein